MQAYQYEMLEMRWTAPAPAGSEAAVNLTATFVAEGKETRVKGFYAGQNSWCVRFLPMEAGAYTYTVDGVVEDRGAIVVQPARDGHHGPVQARGIHLYHADGTPWVGMGTTIYAMMHQDEALIDQTVETLRHAPFTKVRLCVFPKHYNYNHNEPDHYAFGKKTDGTWDVHHPDFAFWDAFERRMVQLMDVGIEVDLILFHPYDRWGFANMPMEDNLVYLDYLLRRFAAYPGMWWSLANEYDLCYAKTMEDWYAIEDFVAKNDPFHHLLGNHNCFRPFDAARENITHMSWQTKQLTRIEEMQRRYGKPVTIDECCYEGDLPECWGSISGVEMTARFWRTAMAGGYCTHGETFFPDEREIVWWARGGELRGESPARIAFLRGVLESLPAPVTPLPGELAGDLLALSEENFAAQPEQVSPERRDWVNAMVQMGQMELARFQYMESGCRACCMNNKEPQAPTALLWYLDVNQCRRYNISLPEDGAWQVDVLDTWNMTRETVAQDVCGRQTIELPGRPWMAIVAMKQ